MPGSALLPGSRFDERALDASLRARPAPDAEAVAQGAKFRIQIHESLDYAGTIRGESDEHCWGFESAPQRSPYSPANLRNPPALTFLDREEREHARIERVRGAPAAYRITGETGVLGTVRPRGVFRNRYRIELENEAWLFHMPLFSVRFRGVSSAGRRIWVVVGPSKKEWNVLLEPGGSPTPVLFALAFIHRQWWCYA